MRRLDLTPKAQKFLSKLPAKQFRQIVVKVFALLENPEPQDARPLKGYSFHRVDSGEYRIIYEFNDDVVFIILIGKRNDDEVYRHLKRSFG